MNDVTLIFYCVKLDSAKGLTLCTESLFTLIKPNADNQIKKREKVNNRNHGIHGYTKHSNERSGKQ